MKPCDCKDERDYKKLKETKFQVNHDSITVNSNNVTLIIGPISLKIPQYKFKKFVEWYLEEQN